MATEPKTLPHALRISAENRRIGRLAEQSAFFNAQRWFTRERAWINEQQLQLCRIPASTFFEQQRAEWFRAQLESLEWKARIDRAGNVLATFQAAQSEPLFVVSAHLDTVLAPNRPEEIYYAPDGRLCGPGVSDNGSGLAALLALAKVLSETIELHGLASSVLLVANVGEEGEGNLNGMRYLCHQAISSTTPSPSTPKPAMVNSNGPKATPVPQTGTVQLAGIKAFIVLDGPSLDHITAQALASRRFEISFTGPGGHSWNDYGTPNPVHALAEVVSFFVQSADSRISGERKRRSAYNFGLIEGGTSINSIASSARAKLDLRSEEPGILDDFSILLNSTVERALERENRSACVTRLTAKIRELGSRPGGKLAEESPLLRTVQAVDAHLHIRSRVDCASTDANIPLSLGIPAISIGTGGQGGGAHTSQEWYQPDGRELGLQRILLIAVALAEANELQQQTGISAEL
ncbi:MAG: M20/M25/M40 family metallo-hydrolase [Bryobacteraceae bacterium]